MLSVIALIIFLAVACVGGYMALQMQRGRDLPGWLAHTHGLAAAVGIGLLAYAVFAGAADNRALLALALFLAAAAGGVLVHLLAKRVSSQPTRLAVAHGGFAVLAIAVLSSYLFYRV